MVLPLNHPSNCCEVKETREFSPEDLILLCIMDPLPAGANFHSPYNGLEIPDIWDSLTSGRAS